MSNYYTIHLKLILHVNYMSTKKKKKVMDLSWSEEITVDEEMNFGLGLKGSEVF